MLTNNELFDLHRSLIHPIRPGRVPGMTPRKVPAPLDGAFLLACERCVRVVEARTGIARERLLGWRRIESVQMARHMAIYVARKATTGSSPQLGRFFQRKHACILRSTALIQRRMDAHAPFASMMNELVRSAREATVREAVV